MLQGVVQVSCDSRQSFNGHYDLWRQRNSSYSVRWWRVSCLLGWVWSRKELHTAPGICWTSALRLEPIESTQALRQERKTMSGIITVLVSCLWQIQLLPFTYLNWGLNNDGCQRWEGGCCRWAGVGEGRESVLLTSAVENIKVVSTSFVCYRESDIVVLPLYRHLGFLNVSVRESWHDRTAWCCCVTRHASDSRMQACYLKIAHSGTAMCCLAWFTVIKQRRHNYGVS